VTFEAAIEGVEGWLSEDQAARLYERAAAVPAGGTIVEIGSFRGRSTIVLAIGAGKRGGGARVIAIDPHAGNDRGPRQWLTSEDQGERDRQAFMGNLERAGVAATVSHLRLRSSEALGALDGPVDLLYVDGAHRYRPAREDLRRWGARIVPGGTLLVHDAFSSVGVTAAILRELALSSRFEYRGRSRSLAEYRRVSPRSRPRNCARQLAQLPWFARNLAIKLALAARAQRVALALGHRAGDEWPY